MCSSLKRLQAFPREADGARQGAAPAARSARLFGVPNAHKLLSRREDAKKQRSDTRQVTPGPTVARVGVTQGLFGVQAEADVAAVGRRRAVARARALVVTAAAAHGARRPG